MKRFRQTLCAMFLVVTSVVYAAPCPPDHFILPVNGESGSPIQPDRGGRPHQGLDIPAPQGSVVAAAAGGTVSVRSDPDGYGDFIVITHPNGVETLYAHISKINVSDGQKVAQGQNIGLSGGAPGSQGAGNSGGEHLHFEVGTAAQPVLQVGGQNWDAAAGLSRGTTITRGACMTMAAGPGGQVAASAPNGATPTPTPTPRPTPGGETPTAGGTGAPDQAGGFDGTIGTTGEIDLQKILPTPHTFIVTTLEAMKKFNLAKHFNSLGLALLFACFVYSLVSANYFHRSDQYFAILGRLVIAAGLIMAAPTIAGTTMRLWETTYNTLEAKVARPAVETLEDNMNGFAPALKEVAGLTVVLETAAAVIPDTAGVDGFEEITKLLGQVTGQITKGLFTLMVLMGAVYGVYFLAIYTSALITILAGVLLPIIAAFLVLPGMASWFGKWLNMLIVSLVTLVIFPFVLFVAVELGVNQPVKNITNVFGFISQQGTALSSLTQNPPPITDPGAWLKYLGQIKELLNPVGLIQRLIAQWIFDLVMIAVAILAAIFLMRQVPSLIGGFIGGVAGAAAGAVTGGALAGMLAAPSLGKIKGGGKSEDKPMADNKSQGPSSTTAGGSRAALPSAGGGSRAALPAATGGGGSSQASSPGGGSRAALPAAGGSGGGSSGGSGGGGSGGSSSGAALPGAGGTSNYRSGGGQRGNLANDGSVNTVDTTATGGRQSSASSGSQRGTTPSGGSNASPTPPSASSSGNGGSSQAASSDNSSGRAASGNAARGSANSSSGVPEQDSMAKAREQSRNSSKNDYSAGNKTVDTDSKPA
jgi:cold shock CspA family protein